jgi:hypothetical protein
VFIDVGCAFDYLVSKSNRQARKENLEWGYWETPLEKIAASLNFY